jgi:hypothetical protein
MSTSSPAAQAPAPKMPLFLERLKPYMAPYYLTVAAVLGAITAVFATVTILLILIVSNFNILWWIE